MVGSFMLSTLERGRESGDTLSYLGPSGIPAPADPQFSRLLLQRTTGRLVPSCHLLTPLTPHRKQRLWFQNHLFLTPGSHSVQGGDLTWHYLWSHMSGSFEPQGTSLASYRQSVVSIPRNDISVSTHSHTTAQTRTKYRTLEFCLYPSPF